MVVGRRGWGCGSRRRADLRHLILRELPITFRALLWSLPARALLCGFGSAVRRRAALPTAVLDGHSGLIRSSLGFVVEVSGRRICIYSCVCYLFRLIALLIFLIHAEGFHSENLFCFRRSWQLLDVLLQFLLGTYRSTTYTHGNQAKPVRMYLVVRVVLIVFEPPKLVDIPEEEEGEEQVNALVRTLIWRRRRRP
jgi:hypothetical protein